MEKTKGLFVASAGFWLAGFMLFFLVSGLFGQQSSTPEQKAWTTAEDHQNMMQQLGIKETPSGTERQRRSAQSGQLRRSDGQSFPESA